MNNDCIYECLYFELLDYIQTHEGERRIIKLIRMCNKEHLCIDNKRLVGLALQNGVSYNILNTLLKNSANVHIADKYDNDIIHLGIKNEASVDLVELLIQYRPCIDRPNQHGNLPIHTALICDRPLSIVRLVSTVTTVNSTGYLNRNALQLALYKQSSNEVILYLLNLIQDINHVDINNSTALHMACYYKTNTTIIKAILDEAPYLDSMDNNMCTPLHYALHFELDVEIVSLLYRDWIDYGINNRGDTITSVIKRYATYANAINLEYILCTDLISCPICLVDNVSTGVYIHDSDCGPKHSVCQDCLYQLKQNSEANCPLCRQQMYDIFFSDA